MGKVTKREMPMWAKMGHKKPTTRREFLGYGLIPFAARALVPGALGLLTALHPEEAAAAASCAAGSGSAPFITVNLSGGASLSSNYMPLDVGGNPLASYSKMGNGSGGNIPARVMEFGVQGFAATSPFLAGVQRTASQAARDRTAFVAGCVQSRDDSAENAFDASGMAFKAGVVGSILPNIGSRGNATGIGQKSAIIAPPPPLAVNNLSTIVNAIGYTASIKNNLTVAQREKLARLTSNLSASQSRRLASISSAAHVQTLVECAGIKNVGLVVSGANAVDPLLDTKVGAAIGTAWGINTGTATNNESRVFSAMAYNAMNGNAGTINLERGGYDYHDGTRTTGDQRDGQAGETIGRLLETAHIMQKPVFIYVTSDGSVGSADSAMPGSVWAGDRGNAGMMFMIMYHPSGRPATTGPQIGYYNSGQEAEEGTPIGNKPDVAAQAAFANYTKFAHGSNWETIFGKAVPRGGAIDAILPAIIKVA